jgi:hypothetical protein
MIVKGLYILERHEEVLSIGNMINPTRKRELSQHMS